MKLFDFDNALERFMGEKDILIEVLEPYIENLNSNIDILGTLDPEKDTKKIREVAHSIKGSSLNLDIVPLGKEAEKLEDMAYNNKISRIPDMVLTIKKLAAQTISELQSYL